MTSQGMQGRVWQRKRKKVHCRVPGEGQVGRCDRGWLRVGVAGNGVAGVWCGKGGGLLLGLCREECTVPREGRCGLMGKETD